MVAFAELDERVPFGQQLGQDEGPIVFFNTFHVAPEEVDAFMDAWKVDGEFMKRQPGYISTQLHRGIAGSTTFINVAEWESVAAHEQNFRGTDRFPRWRAAIGPYFASPPAVEHFSDV